MGHPVVFPQAAFEVFFGTSPDFPNLSNQANSITLNLYNSNPQKLDCVAFFKLYTGSACAIHTAHAHGVFSTLPEKRQDAAFRRCCCAGKSSKTTQGLSITKWKYIHTCKAYLPT